MTTTTTTPTPETAPVDLALVLAGLDAQIALLTAWRDHLTAWRQSLCDQLLALPRHDAREQGLRLSIVRIDHGLAGTDLPANPPLDALMHGAGYVSWYGTLPQTAYMLAALVRRRDRLERPAPAPV